MILDTRRNIGRAGMALAIAYCGANGYTVNIPMNDTQWYDLVVEKDGIFYTVQCKATASKDNTIGFTSAGGTNGAVYDNLLNHSLDFLFCVNKNGTMFHIPVKDIREYGNCRSIKLNEESPKNNQGFPIYKYVVMV